MNETTHTSYPEVTSAPPQPVNQQQKKSGWRVFWLVLAGLIFICGFCGILPFVLLLATNNSTTKTEKGVEDLSYSYVLGNQDSDNKLLAIYIDQPILTSSQDYSDDLLTAILSGQYVFGYRIKDDLMKVSKDDSIKGIALIINSPGGTVVGARAIADGVAYYKKATNKPVYAYVQDMAASGAYWAAASTDKIIAEQGSLTGSIGVLMGPFDYYDKLVSLGTVGTENGITITYITGGKYKDLGNPTRKITDEEMRVLQSGIDSEYDNFVRYVSGQRKIPELTIRDDIRALIYSAGKAKELGLIDAIGTREDMLSDLAAKAGVSDYQLVKIGTSTTLFGSLFSSLTKVPVQKSEASARVCVLCGKPLYFFGNPLDY